MLFLLNATPWKIVLSSSFIIMLLGIDLARQFAITQRAHLNRYDPTKDLETARCVQDALLEIDTPELENVSIAKRCIPAKNLGGDFYTFVNKTVKTLSQKAKTPGVLEYNKKQENLLGIVVGDVAGHGVSSALVMALASGILGRIGYNNHSPALILEKANNDIQRFIQNSQISHVTAFYCSLNIDNYNLTYSNAGHPPAIVLHDDDSYEKISTDGIFMGMYKKESFEEKEYQCKKNDRIFIFTDGIVETINNERVPFGSKRLINLAIKHKNKNANELLDIIYDKLEDFQGIYEQKDDQTLIIIDIA